MAAQPDALPHVICPKCHLPVSEQGFSVVHEGHRYHEQCAPVPEIAGVKDDPYTPRI